MANREQQGVGGAPAPCRAAVIWIDWYAYHVARFRGLQAAFGTQGEVTGVELVGGVGVHAGLRFREDLPASLPIVSLFPEASWSDTSKLQIAVAVWKKLSALNPELVLVPGYYNLPAVAAALWARMHGRLSVLMTESTAFDHVRTGWKERLKGALIRLLFDRAVTGGSAHRTYLQQLGFPMERVRGLYDVVDNRRIADRCDELRATSSAAAQGLPEHFFLFVGRLAEEKNVAGLLRAWVTYRDGGGTWPLVLVGNGPEAGQLKDLAKLGGYAQEVFFAGHKSSGEIMAFQSFASCFVLPSTREPWGLVVNEAMAASLPVIVSTRCGCAMDLVEHGRNGLLFNPSRERELADCLRLMEVLSPAERERMGAASAERIAAFSPENFGQEVLSLLEPSQRDEVPQLSPFPPGGACGMTTTARGTLLRMDPAMTARPRVHAPWLQVLSHLDPKYGGLSSVVPQMASQLVLAEQTPVQIAAFCSPGEQRALPGYPELTVSHWPTGPLPWMREAELNENWKQLLSSSEGLHIHGLWETSTRVAAQTARQMGKPYIVSAHGMLEPWALRNKAFKKRVYAALIERANLQGATCLHALTAAEAEDYRRFGAERPIAVIPNGVTAPDTADPELFLEAFPQARGRRVLLFLGRLHFKKGLDLLVPAWAELARRFPDALLVLAGPDSENSLAAIEKLVAEGGLEDRVLFTGMLRTEMKWSALAAAECFLLPSYSEGLSIATLEAMSVGVPVLITTNCHLPEAAAAGAGWEIKATRAALRAAMEDLLASTPEQNAARGLHGKRLVQDRFSWQSVGRQMSELYRWISDGVRPQSFELQEDER